MAAKRKIDYDSIEEDWRAGLKSVPQLAKEYKERTGVSVTHGAINKHFKAKKIPRDLTAKIKAKAEAKVSESIVSGKVSADTIIEANAEHQAQVVMHERKDVAKARTIAMSLLEELESQVTDKELYKNLGELLHAPDDKGQDKRNELYEKVISFGSRTDGMKKLSDSLRVLIELERKVNKIDDSNTGNETYEDFLRRVHAVR